MKLLHRDLSPLSAQVRAQIYAKQLPLPLEAIAQAESLDGLGENSVPRLVLDDGGQLTEAWAIMEYLEALYPLPRLMPETVLAQARVRVKASIANRYLLPLLLPMFLKIKYSQYADVDIVQSCKRLRAIYRHFETLLPVAEGESFASESGLDLADCVLAPMIFFAQSLPRLYGQPDSLGEFPTVAAWWAALQSHPAIERVTYELQRGFQTYLAT
ncbi:glutathione S-transferase family protein [Halioxenophilus sp. WMMB6]|uniref:glutathione S-transferase family protein n=1 Tax=Halioxenophilus sp. WMMB6 TaxID=3073815 RepID=UPI00295E6A2F|nr:glutathione S-transferase family protein [Halioxenophilus sp. WMMB6]